MLFMNSIFILIKTSLVNIFQIQYNLINIRLPLGSTEADTVKSVIPCYNEVTYYRHIAK